MSVAPVQSDNPAARALAAEMAYYRAHHDEAGTRAGLADLRRPGVTTVLAAPTVPVGKAAAAALVRAGVALTPVSLEDAVTGVVTKVRLGEADAGIAYVTDLQAGQVDGVALPGTRTSLAIAAVAGDPRPADTDLFIAFVRSSRGQQILRSFGFS